MDWPSEIDPAALRQPDRFSCGAASLVAARLLLDQDSGEDILDLHRRVVRWWPRFLGTPPWAVAREFAGLTGRPVRTYVARWRPASGFDELAQRLSERPVAVYIGNRWLPRHVVLAVGIADRGVRVFEPGTGTMRLISRDRWVAHRVGVAGWSRVWLVV